MRKETSRMRQNATKYPGVRKKMRQNLPWQHQNVEIIRKVAPSMRKSALKMQQNAQRMPTNAS